MTKEGRHWMRWDGGEGEEVFSLSLTRQLSRFGVNLAASRPALRGVPSHRNLGDAGRCDVDLGTFDGVMQVRKDVVCCLLLSANLRTSRVLCYQSQSGASLERFAWSSEVLGMHGPFSFCRSSSLFHLPFSISHLISHLLSRPFILPRQPTDYTHTEYLRRTFPSFIS